MSLKIDRRRFIAAAGIGITVPLFACRAQPVAPGLTAEAFGAVGDGRIDDYDAFERLVRAANDAGGGTISLRPGARYFFDRHVVPGQKADDLMFANCRGLTIEGNGAQIRVQGQFERTEPSVRSLAGLIFRDCRQVSLRNIELAGGVQETTRLRGLKEPSSHGLIFQSCSDVTIDGVTVRHFAADGLYIRESKSLDPAGLRQASRNFTVRNSRFLFNARQGLSVIQLRGGLFENCDFSYTGFVDSNGTIGPYGGHSPAAGVDVEPNNTPMFGSPVDVLTGDLTFRGCRMAGNYGAAFLAGKYAKGQPFQEAVRLETCELICNAGLTGGRDGFIFDVPGGAVTGCTLTMVDKVAYLGWYPESAASPRFVGNTVRGRNRRPGFPLFVVRMTRGTPTIENNRFIDDSPTLLGAALKPWLLAVENQKAVVRNNQFLSESHS